MFSGRMQRPINLSMNFATWLLIISAFLFFKLEILQSPARASNITYVTTLKELNVNNPRRWTGGRWTLSSNTAPKELKMRNILLLQKTHLRVKVLLLILLLILLIIRCSCCRAKDGSQEVSCLYMEIPHFNDPSPL